MGRRSQEGSRGAPTRVGPGETEGCVQRGAKGGGEEPKGPSIYPLSLEWTATWCAAALPR